MSEKIYITWRAITIWGVIILVLALILAGYRAYTHFTGPSVATEAINQAPMITFAEIQRQLVERGHNIKVDGRIGKETLNAWSVEICNDYYRKTIARMEK